MPSIRSITAGSALIAGVLMASAIGATAQTAQAEATPGKPIQLHQNAVSPGKAAKPKSHVKTVAKSQHRRVAAKTARTVPLPAKAPVVTTVAAIPALDAPADPTLAFAEPMPKVVTVAGQSVQVAVPDEVNDIDRTAGTSDNLPPKNAATADAAAVPASSPPASTSPVPAATVIASARQEQGPTASVTASWLAQVLAALGGAIAAASAAWFMIGSTPQRMYG